MIIWLSHLNLNEQDFSIYAQNYFLYQVLNIQIPPDLLIVRQIRGVYNGIQMKYNGKICEGEENGI